MKKTLLLLLWLASLVTTPLCGQFGYISYSTVNIGDDIQSIAAMRFLPKNSLPIDRDFMSLFKHQRKVHALVNGFFMSTKDFQWCRTLPAPDISWPPSSDLVPFFISFHLNREVMPIFFTKEGLDYFKKYEPIGTRDYDTLVELKRRGIKAYFSGCLTLTLENPHHHRNNIVYLVDLPEKEVRYLKSKIKGAVEVLTHEVPAKIQHDHNARLKHAEALLEKYRQAKCVVTSKLHVSMPCLAFETPVLFVGYFDERFYGLKELLRYCSPEELFKGEYDFDLNNPTPNTKAYLPLRNKLIERVSNWVAQTK